MRSETEVRNQRDAAQTELNKLDKYPAGTGKWRRQKGYVDALNWVLEEE